MVQPFSHCIWGNTLELNIGVKKKYQKPKDWQAVLHPVNDRQQKKATRQEVSLLCNFLFLIKY